MRKRILIPILLVSVPTAILAQIFGPTIVFDPTVAGRVLTEIAQIVKLYNTATQTYNQIAYNASWFTNKSRWLGIATQVVNSNTRSIFGETAALLCRLSIGRECHLCQHRFRQCGRRHDASGDARHREQPQQSAGERPGAFES